MILCETFWKPSLADFAKQHKQTIYSFFLQVPFCVLFSASRPPPSLPSLSFFHCLLAFVSAPSSSLSVLLTPLHPQLYQALGYGFGLRVTEVMDFFTKRRKKGMITFALSSALGAEKFIWVSGRALLLWAWDQHSTTHHERDCSNVAEDKGIISICLDSCFEILACGWLDHLRFVNMSFWASLTLISQRGKQWRWVETPCICSQSAWTGILACRPLNHPECQNSLLPNKKTSY